VAIVGCVASLAVLTTYMWKNERLSLWVLLLLIAACFVGELLLRKVGGRVLKAFHKGDGSSRSTVVRDPKPPPAARNN